MGASKAGRQRVRALLLLGLLKLQALRSRCSRRRGGQAIPGVLRAKASGLRTRSRRALPSLSQETPRRHLRITPRSVQVIFPSLAALSVVCALATPPPDRRRSRSSAVMHVTPELEVLGSNAGGVGTQCPRR